MNISGIFNSTYLSNIIGAKRQQNIDAVSSSAKTQNIQKPDVVAGATKTKDGDHYFDARA